MEDLRDIIKFVKEYYSKSPAERRLAQQGDKVEVSLFKAMKPDPKPDLTTTLV